MRRLAYAYVLTFCGLAVCAAAQSLQFESFDRGGLAGRAQTAEERELNSMITAHRAGDAADAARIQRKLAAYYRGKGDHTRARAAEQRALAASEWSSDATRRGIRQPAGVPMPAYVPIPLPAAAPAEPEHPAFGNVPAPVPDAPASVNIPAYEPGDVKAPVPPDKPASKPAGTKSETAGTAQTPAAAAPALVPVLSGRFLGTQGRTLHTWEFRPDGTFEHAWTTGVTPAGDVTMEAGAFSIAGPFLTLIVRGRADTNSTAPARAGTQQIRRLRIGMLGPGAGNAITLDGVMLNPQDVK